MPVLDHDIDPSTQHDTTWPRWCSNKPRPLSGRVGGGYFASDREYLPDGSFRIIQRFIKHWQDMSTECRYDKGLTDPACVNCCWRHQGADYAASTIEKASVK